MEDSTWNLDSLETTVKQTEFLLTSFYCSIKMQDSQETGKQQDRFLQEEIHACLKTS